MLRIYWTLMIGLATGGAVLTLTATSNLHLAGGILALTLGAGGISAGAAAAAQERHPRLGGKRSRPSMPVGARALNAAASDPQWSSLEATCREQSAIGPHCRSPGK